MEATIEPGTRCDYAAVIVTRLIPTVSLAIAFLAASSGFLNGQIDTGFANFISGQRERHYTKVPHEVLAFYYPWYGTTERHGQWRHWEKVRTEDQAIGSSTHYPVLGAYDSYDPAIIHWHIEAARTNGVSGFISSWWGRDSYEDGVMPLLLEEAGRAGFKISAYWETAPGMGSAQIERAISDLAYLVTRYGTNAAFLKVDGMPVVFVYGRVMSEVPLTSWPKIVTEARARAGDFLLIADGYETSHARLFDGVHTYNVADSISGKTLANIEMTIASEYASSVKLARQFGRISCLTVIPGYDDTKIRNPGLRADRLNGQTYRTLWNEAIEAKPDWILITSWNEWHEGSEIEPSVEHGGKYLELTRAAAPKFQGSPSIDAPAPAALDYERLGRLRQQYSGKTVGLLPGASGEPLLWLLQSGLDIRGLTWADVVDPARCNPGQLPVLVYAGGEHYTGTVKTPGDVTQALTGYLRAGGFIALIPTGPWPFYDDDSRGSQSTPITGDLGVPIAMGADNLRMGEMLLHVDTNALPGLAATMPGPMTGDLRWRPSIPSREPGEEAYFGLVQLRDAQGRTRGDAVAYIEHKSSALASGKSLYVWMRTADVFGSDEFFASLFEFIATKVGATRVQTK